MTLYASRERFDGISKKIGRLLSRLPVSPNAWTATGLALAAISGILAALGAFLLSAIVFAVSSAIDLVDGSVARAKRRVTKKGAYLDTISDRYSEFFLLFFLLFSGFPDLYLPPEAWILLLCFGSVMTTYAKAAASEKGLGEVRGGFLERAERLVGLVLALLASGFSKTVGISVIAFLAVATNLSAVQRILAAFRK